MPAFLAVLQKPILPGKLPLMPHLPQCPTAQTQLPVAPQTQAIRFTSGLRRHLDGRGQPGEPTIRLQHGSMAEEPRYERAPQSFLTPRPLPSGPGPALRLEAGLRAADWSPGRLVCCHEAPQLGVDVHSLAQGAVAEAQVPAPPPLLRNRHCDVGPIDVARGRVVARGAGEPPPRCRSSFAVPSACAPSRWGRHGGGAWGEALRVTARQGDAGGAMAAAPCTPSMPHQLRQAPHTGGKPPHRCC